MSNELPTKRCPRCFETKAHSAFSKTRANRDGLNYYCRACCAELRYERLEREFHDPLAEEEKFQKQLRKIYR